jgi:hypothetical protein
MSESAASASVSEPSDAARWHGRCFGLALRMRPEAPHDEAAPTA